MGRKQFESVVAMAAKKKMTLADFSETLSLAAGTGKGYEIFAPVGFIAKVKSMYLAFGGIAGATSGSHVCAIGSSSLLYVTRAESAYNQSLRWYYNNWDAANISALPASLDVQSKILDSLVFDDKVPLRIGYTNSTNAALNANVTLRVIYLLEEVAK